MCIRDRPFGSLHLPENAEQDSDICYDKGGVHLRFKVEGDTRYLSFSAPEDVYKRQSLSCFG